MRLYILGDFFEAWIGDDAMTPFQRSICQALRELSDSGTAIFLMHGNRDFMLGKAFCKQAGCTLLKDPSVVQFNGEPVLLMHGDSLCTRDEAYMKLRRYLRNPITLFILRHLPLRTRHKLARKLRSESRAQTRMKANDIVDVTPRRSAADHAAIRRENPDPRPYPPPRHPQVADWRTGGPAHCAGGLGQAGLGVAGG